MEQHGEAGCSDKGWDYNAHGIHGKERLAALHIGEIIQCIRIPPIQCEPEQQLACQGKDIGTVLGYGRKLFLQGNLLMLRYGHHFLCLCKTEHVAQGKDASVNNGYQEISPSVAARAQRFNQRHRYDIDDSNGNHGCHGPEGINLRTLLYVLGHGPAQGPVRDIDAGISQNQNAVCNTHVHNLGCTVPARMGPEGQYQNNGCQGRRHKKPGPVSPPSGMGPVGQASDDGVINSVPKT